MASSHFSVEALLEDWLDAGKRIFLVDLERGVRPDERVINRLFALYPELALSERREVWRRLRFIAAWANKMWEEEARG